jgi:hypothetical protein
MPAKIVETHEGRSRDFWIEHESVRVGHGNYEIALAEAAHAGHMLSVVFEAGKYYVYNKSGNPTKLAGAALSYNTRTPWPDGAVLKLGRTELLLVVEADPKPAQRTAFATVLETKKVDAAILRPEAQKVSRKLDPNMFFNLLIVFGMLAAGVIFYAAIRMNAPPEEEVKTTLEQILNAVDQEWQGDPRHQSLREMFQFAFAAESRRRMGEAYGRYRAARDLILRRAQERRRDPDGADVGLLDFCKRKLERLAQFAGGGA